MDWSWPKVYTCHANRCEFSELATTFIPVKRALIAGTLFLGIASCGRATTDRADIDPQILAEVNRIRAIDNHAHPVRFVASGPPDREFDALPVDSMEPASDPVQFRPDHPSIVEAWRELWNYPYADMAANHLNEWSERKKRTAAEQAEKYPAWVLDQAGIDIMLANRVHMGPSIQPPRFRWVPYVDALVFPLDNSALAARNSDRKAFFTLEDGVRAVYLKEAKLAALPPTLDEYLRVVVTPALERHKQGGAVAEKFEIAYLRPFGFEKVERSVADKTYSSYVNTTNPPPDTEYKAIQDYLFRFIAIECGRLGMAVHVHTGHGAGGYYDVRGANPMLLEPLFNDPEMRKTQFVMVHGGWPYTREVAALLYKPNVYLDYALQPLLFTSTSVARSLREWLEWVPEKVLFGSDGYPYGGPFGWEETTWLGSKHGREALAIALTGMMRDGAISRDRALEIARMVLRGNAGKLYGL